MTLPESAKSTQEILAAVSGGLLVSMAEAFTLFFSPTSAKLNKKDIARSVVETSFSLVAALVSAFYVTPYIVYKIGIENSQTSNVVFLMVGLVFWKSVPGLVIGLSKIFPQTFLKVFPLRIISSKDETNDQS